MEALLILKQMKMIYKKQKINLTKKDKTLLDEKIIELLSYCPDDYPYVHDPAYVAPALVAEEHGNTHRRWIYKAQQYLLNPYK